MASSTRPSLPMVYVEMQGIASPRIAIYVTPGSTINTLIQKYHEEVFDKQSVSPLLKQPRAKLLRVPGGQQHSHTSYLIEDVDAIQHNDLLAILPCDETKRLFRVSSCYELSLKPLE